jgi:oxygen-dependent protoporphyrinogen oxidase
MSIQVCVIGGGISGLTAALELHRQGVSVRLFEQASSVGGVLRSVTIERADGFTFDCGANTLRVSSDTVRSLIASCVPPAAIRTAAPSANKRYIMRGGNLHALQAHPLALLRTNLLSTKAKLRLLCEPFIPAKKNMLGSTLDDESLADFFHRRIGSEPVRYLLNPFVTGVYGAPPEHLGVQGTFPTLERFERESGSLVKGFIKQRWAERKQPRALPTIMTFVGGMQTLAKGMAEQLGERVQTGVAVRAVQPNHDNQYNERGRWRVSTSEGDVVCEHCIVATEAPEAALLLALADAEASGHLSSLQYGKITLVHLGYKQALVRRPTDSFGFLIPQSEDEPLLGALWNSAFFSHTAPPEHAAFTLFVGEETTNKLLQSAEHTQRITVEHPLLKPVVARFQEIMGIQGEPCASNVHCWRRAIPRYDVGYARFEALWQHVEQRNAGLHLLGSYRGGVSLHDCMLNGIKLANGVANTVANAVVKHSVGHTLHEHLA